VFCDLLAGNPTTRLLCALQVVNMVRGLLGVDGKNQGIVQKGSTLQGLYQRQIV
jgi:hypothetical protein